MNATGNAKQGDAEAQLAVGLCYYLGRGEYLPIIFHANTKILAACTHTISFLNTAPQLAYVL
jgi:hypothetical protein